VARRSRVESSRAASFRRGFRNRNPLVLVGAAAVALVALAAFQAWVVAGGFTLVQQGRFLRITHDDYVHVTYAVAEQRHDAPDQPAIYLFGGSSAMECFTSEEEFGAQIGGVAGEGVSVVSLAAHAQTLAQTLAIIDNLPQGDGRGMIVVGLSPMHFTTDPSEDAGMLEGKPMPLVSPRLETVLGREGYEPRRFLGVLPGVFDYVTNYLKVRVKDGPPWFEPLVYERHYYGAGPVYPLAAKARGARRDIAADRAGYPRFSSYNLRLLAQVTALARERGYEVVWFDQPINLAAAAAAGEPAWGGVLPASRRAAAELARRLDVSYLHLQRRSGVANADFSDLYHLVLSGRLKWQPVMAEALGRVLRDETVARHAAE
jgi:hypothetical protein